MDLKLILQTISTVFIIVTSICYAYQFVYLFILMVTGMDMNETQTFRHTKIFGKPEKSRRQSTFSSLATPTPRDVKMNSSLTSMCLAQAKMSRKFCQSI